MQSEIVDKPGAISLPPIAGQVEFKHVTFRYFGSGDPVLSDVSFSAAPGQTVALLGATGSGKTTIINLIPRFYDASAGAILIDGHDLRDVTIDSLRSQIGIVLQETNLFSGTIRDNIAFGRPDATLEQVQAAAQAAAADDEFMMAFPQGYDTPVGERGTTLSGGAAPARCNRPRAAARPASDFGRIHQQRGHADRAADPGRARSA